MTLAIHFCWIPQNFPNIFPNHQKRMWISVCLLTLQTTNREMVIYRCERCSGCSVPRHLYGFRVSLSRFSRAQEYLSQSLKSRCPDSDLHQPVRPVPVPVPVHRPVPRYNENSYVYIHACKTRPWRHANFCVGSLLAEGYALYVGVYHHPSGLAGR